MADGEQPWAELSARSQDAALPVADRRAALGELRTALKAVIRTSAAPAAALELL